MADVMERTEMDMMEELPFPGAEPVQEAVKQAEEVAQEAAKAERAEISIAFAKGLCSDPFTAKDGKEYVQIKIRKRAEASGRRLSCRQTMSMRTSTARDCGQRSRRTARPRSDARRSPQKARMAGSFTAIRTKRCRTRL